MHMIVMHLYYPTYSDAVYSYSHIYHSFVERPHDDLKSV